MRKLTLVVSLLLLTGCPPTPPQPDVPPGPPDADAQVPAPILDAGVIDVVTPTPEAAPPAPRDACQLAQEHLLALKCPDGRGGILGGKNKHGVDWAVTCRDDATKGVDLNPACVSKQQTCAGVNSCPR